MRVETRLSCTSQLRNTHLIRSLAVIHRDNCRASRRCNVLPTIMQKYAQAPQALGRQSSRVIISRVRSPRSSWKHRFSAVHLDRATRFHDRHTFGFAVDVRERREQRQAEEVCHRWSRKRSASFSLSLGMKFPSRAWNRERGGRARTRGRRRRACVRFDVVKETAGGRRRRRSLLTLSLSLSFLPLLPSAPLGPFVYSASQACIV